MKKHNVKNASSSMLFRNCLQYLKKNKKPKKTSKKIIKIKKIKKIKINSNFTKTKKRLSQKFFIFQNAIPYKTNNKKSAFAIAVF